MEVLDHSTIWWPTWSHTRRFHGCSSHGGFFLRRHNVCCFVGKENASLYIGCWNFFLFLLKCPTLIYRLCCHKKENSTEKFVDNKRTKKIGEE